MSQDNLIALLGQVSGGEAAQVFRDFLRGSVLTLMSEEVAEEVVRELESFLKPINVEALASLHEAGDELAALHSLNVPNTLHKELVEYQRD